MAGMSVSVGRRPGHCAGERVNNEVKERGMGYEGRFDGEPGLVWYARVTKTHGGDLKVGDWLDSLDHRGARMIYAIGLPDLDSNTRRVGFSEWQRDLTGDWETVRCDVLYDVVDPDSQVAPDGSLL